MNYLKINEVYDGHIKDGYLQEMSETGEELILDSGLYLCFGGVGGEQVLLLVQEVEYFEVVLELTMEESADGKGQIKYDKAERDRK